MMRSVPWVAGCCGPDVEGHALGLELDVETGVGGLGRDVAQLLAVGQDGHDDSSPFVSPSTCVAVSGSAFSSVVVGHRLDVDDAGPRLHHAGQQGEVLAQRVPLEVAGQVHVAQVGVPGEADAEHLVGLALVPVGAGEHRHPRVDHEVVVGEIGLERDAHVARVSVSRASSWKRVSPPV
jgi:hypothetical protein